MVDVFLMCLLLSAERNKAVKEVKAEFATLLKTPCPPKPETEPQLVELRRQVAEKESGRRIVVENKICSFVSFC